MLSLLKNKKGFSMVEMIIVIAIMAILVGGIASYIGYINNGKTKVDNFVDGVKVDNLSNYIMPNSNTKIEARWTVEEKVYFTVTFNTSFKKPDQWRHYPLWLQCG